MNALVTGAAGLIGTNLCRELLAHGDTVRAVIRPGGRSPDAAPLEIVEADVRERGALVEAARGCDVLFHTAATFAYWGVPEAELFRTAVEGARNAVEAAHEAGVARLVLTSSSVTCGSSLRLAPRDERDQLGADEVCPAYFRAKAEAERSAVERAHELDVDLVLALPTITVGGPDDKPVPSNAHLLDYLADPYHFTFPAAVRSTNCSAAAGPPRKSSPCSPPPASSAPNSGRPRPSAGPAPGPDGASPDPLHQAYGRGASPGA